MHEDHHAGQTLVIVLEKENEYGKRGCGTTTKEKTSSLISKEKMQLHPDQMFGLDLLTFEKRSRSEDVHLEVLAVNWEVGGGGECANSQPCV